jgi:hypothetical protein
MKEVKIGTMGIYHMGPGEGDTFGGNHRCGEGCLQAPAIVVSVIPAENMVNLKVFTDADKDIWTTSRHIGTGPMQFEPEGFSA